MVAVDTLAGWATASGRLVALPFALLLSLGFGAIAVQARGPTPAPVRGG